MSEERTRLQNQQISSNTSVSLMKKMKKQLELRFLNGYTNISRRHRRLVVYRRLKIKVIIHCFTLLVVNTLLTR